MNGIHFKTLSSGTRNPISFEVEINEKKNEFTTIPLLKH